VLLSGIDEFAIASIANQLHNSTNLVTNLVIPAKQALACASWNPDLKA